MSGVEPWSLQKIAANQGYAPGNGIGLANVLVGRVVWKDKQNWTVTSCEAVPGSVPCNIAVYDPIKNTVTVYADLATFENWAYGRPISCGEDR